MRIVPLSTETSKLMEAEGLLNVTGPESVDWQSRARRRGELAEKVKASLNAPIDLGSVVRVEHESKMDRYVITFGGGDKSMKLKATDEVAAFVSEHMRKAGYWMGRMEKGTLVDAVLVTLD